MRRSVAVLELAGAAALVVLHRVLWNGLGLREHLLVYAAGSAERLSSGELALFAIQLLGLPAAVLAADAFARLGTRRSLFSIATSSPRATGAALALFATIASALVTVFVFRAAEFSDDERTYLFEARALLAGGIVSPSPRPMTAFPHHFVVPVGTDHWAGIFPLGQPILLAVGLLVHVPHLCNWLACGLVVWLVARFAYEQWDAETSVLSAALLATSPAWVLVSATLHNIVPTVACATIAVWATARILRGGKVALALLVGGASGFAFIVRPLDGLLLGAFCVAWLVAAERSRRTWTATALVAAAGAPFLGIQLASYHAISGSWFVSPYTVWLQRDWPNARLFGFGRTVWNYNHTFGVAVEKSIAVFVRMNTWAFGWPLSLAALFAIPFGVGADRTTKALFGLVLAHATAYFFYAFAAVHDFGSYYHLFGLPALAVITARVLLDARARWIARGEWLLRLAAAASAFGLVTFVPAQLSRLRYMAKRVREPLVLAERAAQSGPIIVFHDSMHPPGGLASWVYYAPLPGPHLDDAVLWSRVYSTPLAVAVARQYPQRKYWRLRWEEGHAVLEQLALK